MSIRKIRSGKNNNIPGGGLYFPQGFFILKENMEVVANKHSKRYPIELNYNDWGCFGEKKTVSLVFSLENAKKLLSDLENAIKEIEGK